MLNLTWFWYLSFLNYSIHSRFKIQDSLISSLGSVITPVIAAAAAVSGLASNVRAPGPWRPSKFRFDVETEYLPSGILSSFMARQAEHPG